MIRALAESMRRLAEMKEPIGRVLQKTKLAEWLVLGKKIFPLGVLLIVFECRPVAVIQMEFSMRVLIRLLTWRWQRRLYWMQKQIIPQPVMLWKHFLCTRFCWRVEGFKSLLKDMNKKIKKIENTTNRQITFSKRSNGLIKKAYELSVLCDVDVAIIMFSPSGRASIFSGCKSIEEIISRYINLPEHERGRLQNQKCLERALGRLKTKSRDRNVQNQTRSASVDLQVEEAQQEIGQCKSHMIEMEKRLRVFEGDPSEITTLCEAEYREQILEETLKHVRARKQVLEKYSSAYSQSSSQVFLPRDAINVNNLVPTNQGNIFDRLPPRDPRVQIMNFANVNGPLHQRQNEHVIRARVESANNVNVQPPEFGQMIDMNIYPWTQFCPPGNSMMLMAQPGERPFSDGYIPQFSP